MLACYFFTQIASNVNIIIEFTFCSEAEVAVNQAHKVPELPKYLKKAMM
jgi:hypothetical protein